MKYSREWVSEFWRGQRYFIREKENGHKMFLSYRIEVMRK